jgi:hypothetical protein
MNPFTFFRGRQAPEMVVVLEASIPDAKRMLGRCQDAGINAVLGGKECCSGGGCSPKAAVMVPADQVHAVQSLLQADWHAQLAREGADPEIVARLQAAAQADPDAGPVCPACGHVGELARGACADCGLFLG